MDVAHSETACRETIANLMSGMPRKELENLTWDCVDLKAGTLRVEAKGDFVPKTWVTRCEARCHL